MKKINKLMMIAMLLSNSIAYAALQSNVVNDDAETKKYYCPETITCTKDGDQKSCSLNVDNPEYWDNNTNWNPNQYINSGIYILVSVTAPFHSPYVQYVTCSYKHEKYSSSVLHVLSKKEANLEVFYSNPTNWTFPNDPPYPPSDPNPPYTGECSAINNSAQSCPLKVQPALLFYNVNMGGGISASINGTEVTKALTNQYGKINYDAALHYCRGGKQCRIDFASTQGMYYGNVIVDVENTMKIVSIDSINPSYVSIAQTGTYNAVEINFVSFVK